MLTGAVTLLRNADPPGAGGGQAAVLPAAAPSSAAPGSATTPAPAGTGSPPVNPAAKPPSQDVQSVPPDALVQMDDGSYRSIGDLINLARRPAADGDPDFNEYKKLKQVVSGQADAETILGMFGAKKEPEPVDPVQVIGELRKQVDTLTAELNGIRPTVEQITGLRSEAELKMIVDKNAERLPNLSHAMKAIPDMGQRVAATVKQAYEMYQHATGRDFKTLTQEEHNSIKTRALQHAEQETARWAQAFGGVKAAAQATGTNVQVHDNQPVSRQSQFPDGSTYKVTANGILDAQGNRYEQMANGHMRMISSDIPSPGSTAGSMLSPDANQARQPGAKFTQGDLRQMIRSKVDAFQVGS